MANNCSVFDVTGGELETVEFDNLSNENSVVILFDKYGYASTILIVPGD